MSSLISGFFGRKIGVKGVHILSCTSVVITTLLAIVVFFETGISSIPVEIKLFR
jgi:NADH-ubiquinone oxidoreductase chain 5